MAAHMGGAQGKQHGRTAWTRDDRRQNRGGARIGDDLRVRGRIQRMIAARRRKTRVESVVGEFGRQMRASSGAEILDRKASRQGDVQSPSRVAARVIGKKIPAE